jgi:hypothetical protein
LILQRFNDLLAVGARLNFSLLSDDKRIMWLKFFAEAVIHLNSECTSLKGQLNEYSTVATRNTDHQEKVDFVKSVCPLIKSVMFGIFIHLIFPSQLEVTSTKNRSNLVSFGLTENCALATFVFGTIFKTPQGTHTSPLIIGKDDACDMACTSNKDTPHSLDTPETRELLWYEFGVGTFSAKHLNNTRNTYTSMIRDVVSKC